MPHTTVQETDNPRVLDSLPATGEKKSRKEDANPSLVKVNSQVRPERLEAIKLHAVKNRRKICEVLDEALTQNLTTKAS